MQNNETDIPDTDSNLPDTSPDSSDISNPQTRSLLTKKVVVLLTIQILLIVTLMFTAFVLKLDMIAIYLSIQTMIFAIILILSSQKDI